MAQGKKYPQEVKEQARVALCLYNNIAEVSRQMGIPETTLNDWKKEFEKDDSFVELRALRKKEFADKAWQTAFLGLNKTADAIHNLNVELIDASGVSQLANATSKIYQMQALASGDATERVEGKLEVVKFEDL